MAKHQYTSQQALELLMKKLSDKAPAIAEQLQETLNVGKDVDEIEQSTELRKKDHKYRKTSPFTDTEALHIVLNAFQSYFVEQPLFVSSIMSNLTKAAIGVPPQGTLDLNLIEDHLQPVLQKDQDVEKAIEIELQLETQLFKDGEKTVKLVKPSPLAIEQQLHNIDKIRKLINFSEQ